MAAEPTPPRSPPPPIVPPVPPVSPPAPPRPPAEAFSFCVEIAGERNQNVICPFDRAKVRGRFARESHGAGEPGDIVKKMPTIPGLCYLVNTAQRVIRKFDPLNQDANAALLRRISVLHGQVTGSLARAEQTTQQDEVSDDGLKNFALWIRRLLDMKLCREVKGSVPTVDQIKAMPGNFLRMNSEQNTDEADAVIPADKFRYRVPKLVGGDLYQDGAVEEPVVTGTDDDYYDDTDDD